MIVSHKHKFIFVHLGRTAGRSLTVALARVCGPDDIITNAKGFERNHEGFKRHFKATEIRDKIGRDTYDAYFKFTIERNPWDKIVSRYWSYAGLGKQKFIRRFYKQLPQMLTGKPLTFDQWFALRVLQRNTIGFGHYKFPRHYDCYTDGDDLIVDFIGRHEHLDAHVAILSGRLGVPITLDKAFGAKRHKERVPYTELFDERKRRIVEDYFKKDLALLGYAFGQPPPADIIEPRPMAVPA